jgi:hypothetical protein
MSDEATTPISPLTPTDEPSPTIGAAPAVTPVQPLTPAPAPIPASRKASSGRWLNVLLGVAAAVAIGGVAFAAGRSTAPAAAFTFDGAGAGGPQTIVVPGASGAPRLDGQVPGRGFAVGGGVTVDGTVESITGDTMTIKTADGETMEVSLDGDTTYHAATPASAADVAVGSDVSVRVDLGGPRQVQGGATDPSTERPPVTASDVTVAR